MIVFILLGIIFFLGYFFLLDNEEVEVRVYYTETVLPSGIGDINVFTVIIPSSSGRRPKEIREIKYIVIHETDNRNLGTGAYKHSQYLLNNADNANSWHYTVDDKVIYHNLPDNEIAWHAGDGRSEDGGNINGIGIEMCVNVDGSYEKTLENTAELVAYLMYQYELTIDDVKLHQDFSGKICPHRLITENRVEDFYQMIINKYNLRYGS